MQSKGLKFFLTIAPKFAGISIFTAAAFTFTILFTSYSGIYWGWIDEVFYANNLNSLYTPLPIYDPDYFIGIAPLLIKLYIVYPTIGWLGIFLSAVLILSYVLAAHLISDVVEISKYNNYFMSICAGFILAAFSQQFFVRLNFSSIASLSCGIGLMSLLHGKTRTIAITGTFILFMGMLIRWQICLPFVTLFLFYAMSRFLMDRPVNSIKLFRSISILAAIILCVFLMRFMIPNRDSMNFDKPHKLVELLIQEGQVEKLQSKNKSILLEGITSWNTQDENILNDSFYNNISFCDKLTREEGGKFFGRKIVQIFNFSIRYAGDARCMNWFYKSLLLVLVIILTVALLLSGHVMTDRKKYVLVPFLLFGFFQILFLSILFKMEDRFLSPYLLYMLMCIFFMMNARYTIKNSTHKFKIIIVFLLLSSVYILHNSFEQGKYLKKDIKMKTQIIDEINNTFSGKIILLDTYVPYLLQTSPFRVIQLNPSNQYIIGLHYARVHFLSLKNVFADKCPDNSYRGVLECIKQNRENVVWAYWGSNIEFTKRWNAHFYNDTLNFKEINTNSKLSNYSNGYFWDKHKYGYYILE